MSDTNQQFNYPLSPDFIPEKNPNKFGQWLKNLPPKKKAFVFGGLILAVAAVAVGAYLLLAANEPSFTITPDNRELNVGETYTLDFNLEVSGEVLDLNGFFATITYGNDDNAATLEGVYDDKIINFQDDKANHKYILGVKPGAGADLPAAANTTVKFFSLKVTPLKTGNLTLEVSGGLVGSTSTNDYSSVSASFDLVDISAANILYFKGEEGATNEVEVGAEKLLTVKLKADNDAVAVGAEIKYDPTAVKIRLAGAPTFPVVSSPDDKDNKNGTYTLVRGTYGNGVPDDGTPEPQSNLHGFKGKEVIATLFVTGLAPSDDTQIKIENAKIVLDDGNGTLSDIAGFVSHLKVVPEVSISDKIKLSILDSGFQCVKNKNNTYELTAQWTTNKTANSSLSVTTVAGAAIGQTSGDLEKEKQVKSHVLAINLGENSQGKYTIKSSRVKTDGKEESDTVDGSDGKGVPFSCEENIANLKIKDLLVKPADKTADVTFLTVGGSQEGAALGELTKLKEGDQSAVAPACGNGCKDSAAVNAHKFSLTGLKSNTKYVLTVVADDGSGHKTETTVSFTTKQLSGKKNTNVVLKVERDRECNSWLYCRTATQVQNTKGKLENLCFDVGLCNELDANGNCVSPVSLGALGVSGVNQTFGAPQKSGAAAENNFKNLSGLSKVGLDWGNQEIIEGLIHPAAMDTAGKNVNIPNGNFELGDIWPWQNNDVGKLSILEDIYRQGNLQIPNNVLQVGVDTSLDRSPATMYAGARIPLGKISGGDYVLSFTARSETEAGKNLRLQVRSGGVYSDFLSDTKNKNLLGITQTSETFVVRAGRELKGGSAELVFNQVSSDNLPLDENGFFTDFYLDNVSLQPVLHIQNATAAGKDQFVARTCRMYPSSSAPDCDYTASSGGKLYRGWKGFCIEPDPANPNLCLNWYPVDIIAGETDIFATDAQAGYKDRKPLYYCLEANGNYPYAEKNNPIYSGWCKNGKDDVDYYIKIKGDKTIDSRSSDLMKAWGVKYTKKDIINSIVVRWWYGREDNDCTFRNDEHQIVLNKNNNFHATDQFVIDSSKTPQTLVSVEFALNDEGKFGVRGHAEGPDSGAAGAIWQIKLNYYFNEICNVISEVVDPYGLNYAWSSRILKNGWTKENVLGYTYDSDYTPYGAVVPPAENTNHPENWTEPLYVMPPDTTFGNTPYQVRAGSPYSFKNIDTKTGLGTACILGSEENLGKACTTNYDCGYGLNGNSGLCMGINLNAEQQKNIGGGYNRGIDKLSNLFARGLAAWIWVPSDNRYVQICSADNSVQCEQKYENTTECDALKKLCWDYRSRFGSSPQVSNLTVGGKAEGNLWLAGAGGVELKFNSMVAENQLPLTAYRVDWGDGTAASPDINEVANLKIAPRLDPKNPHTMLHTYVCNENGPGWVPAAKRCEFVPRVQVEDNWGWCTGGNDGNLCPSTNTNWAAFSGRVIVEAQ